jgi:hypothetical protein
MVALRCDSGMVALRRDSGMFALCCDSGVIGCSTCLQRFFT